MSEKAIKTPGEILEERIEKLQRRRERKRFLAECLVLLAAIYIVFQYVIGLTFVSGSSMEPTLKDGDLVVFYRLDQEYQKNDVVLIRREGNVESIKRIAAGEYETVEAEGVEEAVEVPAGCYWVRGDNWEKSPDSGTVVTVGKEEIKGRVFFHLGLVQ